MASLDSQGNYLWLTESWSRGQRACKAALWHPEKVAEQVRIGFELPAEKPEPAPNCTQAVLLSNIS